MFATGDLILWIGLLFVIGIAGFFVMSVVLVVRFIGYVGRLVFGGGSPTKRVQAAARDRQGVVCSHPRCGHANPFGARYCRRCGRAFRAAYEFDTYG